MTIAADELDLDAIRAARVFWTTGTGLSAEPSRAATLAALEARDARGSPSTTSTTARCSGPTGDEAGAWARAALAHATVAVGNRDEVAVAVGTREPDEAADALLDLGVRAGGRQARARGRRSRARATSGSRCRRCRSRSSAASAPATRSAARSCTGCSAGWPLERTIRLANAAGAHVAGRLACADAMPTLQDIELEGACVTIERVTVAQALVRFLAAQHIERDGGASASSPAASASSATATSPASARRSSSTRTCCPTTRRATSRRWCTSPPATRASATGSARSRARRRSARARRTWSPARRSRRSTACRCCCCPATRSPAARRIRCSSSSRRRTTARCRSTTASGRCRRYFDRIERPEQLVDRRARRRCAC